jgi:hypothetical protein
MFKKSLVAAAAVAAAGIAFAAPATAIGNAHGNATAAGNGASQIYGNTKTGGYMSPQISLVQGSLNKPCIGLPAKVDAQSLVGVVPVGVQDIPILSSPQNQQCVENSTQAKGDDALSHILDNIPVLTGNGTGNH